MNRLLVSFLVFLPVAFGQPAPAEEEAYSKLVQARDLSRNGNGQAGRRFELLVRAFLRHHPDSPRCGAVRFWLADRLASTHPREAHALYLLSREPRARERAAALALRHGEAPALAVERWIGAPLDPSRVTGKVKLLVFFSDTHPQTRKLLPRVLALGARRAVEFAGIAAVVDDHRSQQPAVLAQRIAARKLPFPVAIDRQRAGRRSVSLERYRGASVPWIVLIDRYARIAWAGGVSVRSVSRFEGKLDELLGQPTYGQLRDRILAGDLRALKALADIRTVASASYLVSIVDRPHPVRLHDATLAVLSKLMPPGYLEGNLADALGRWPRFKRGVRFSFPANRLIRR